MRSLLIVLMTFLALGTGASAFGGATVAQTKKARSGPKSAPGAWQTPADSRGSAQPVVAQPTDVPSAQPPLEARTIESQPPVDPTSQPGQDQFEKNPAEAIAMVCEVMALLRSAEAQLAQAQDAASQQSFTELVASRRRELKAVMSVYKKQTGRHLDVAANCPAK